MKRRITGLHAADRCAADRGTRWQFSWFGFNESSFVGRRESPSTRWLWSFLNPVDCLAVPFSSRLYCNPKALWKLNWFLRDFGYDTELLGRDEVDETQLVGLKGVVKISHIVFNGTSLLRSRWLRSC